MGIEDLNVDEEDKVDQILIIGESQESADKIGVWLEKRNYQWSYAKSVRAARKLAATKLFDLIILDEQTAEKDGKEYIHSLQIDVHLKRSPILFLHPEVESFRSGAGSIFGERVQVLPAPAEASSLLVKAATLLRLRKIKSEQADFESKLAAQNAELRDLTNRFKHELKEARAIQESLLPKSLPKVEKTTFAAYCVPLEAVGGDIYDIWEIEKGRYGLFIGDVTGHGMPAAFIGAMTKMALAYAPKETPEGMFTDINDGLAQFMPTSRFVTAAVVIYESEKGRLLVARAGHPPPLLWRSATGKVEKLEPKGLPLGVMAGAPFTGVEATMEPGDKLLLVTDGITETMNMSGKDLGVNGTADMFADACAGGDIAHCIEYMLAKQIEFSEGRSFDDDNTLIGLERLAE